MEIEVEFEKKELEIGEFKDLAYLVDKLSGAWKGIEYRLEKMHGPAKHYVFVEDVLSEDEFECGIVEKVGTKAYAFSPAVHEMIMRAYLRYVEDFGELN